MSALLEVDSLVRHYPVRIPGGLFGQPATLRAVDGVSFAVSPGKTLGLVGESGCGKSTTAKLVLGLLPPTAGAVRFEGGHVPARRNAEWRALRQRMQMVYQDPLGALDRRLPVVAQVMEPLTVFKIGTPAERREKARDLMAAVGLTPHLFERFPHELSGGQRQRVVLARALILEPSLLVCDEPISALDVSIQAQVINLLLDLQDRFGVAFLFISHDLKVVRQVSHEVAVMYLGRIVEQGEPEKLFHEPAHPYTKALVSAIPSPWRQEGYERIVLQGDPPNPVQVPSGCAFHPRCAYATAACREVRPVLADIGDGRKAACHLLSPIASA
ncbi:MAG: ATP-binding cassette domain-containing protein [Alphaproteobacteria bacterium]|nr:ATP-binding cassette domain-containing protein [Alphaproteobacteria bacterium]MBU0799245.1 ATP-binding cassette domain-containing protein [Alphaproteobacteria bacterium]MBU0885567.1 ATP-binding cassette domain-containing protein [Alphaproteobacteria bacterium]MBU1812956.1 ATP-binding cassette domain-containing protein [Alphaproteobacteria bacterium]MBU2090568.1 ATP-binding cassette domain-containing protein [Alphaproteobacteria bacterium]